MSDQSQNGPEQDPNAPEKPGEENTPKTAPEGAKPFYTRPPFIVGAVIALVAVIAVVIFAGPSGDPASTQDARAEDAANDMAANDVAANASNWELGRPGDIVMGSPDAPVKMVEYASLTCGHCAAFKLAVFPDIKKKYIDTGLVQYTLREFPTPPVSLSIAGFMLARCTGEDRYYQALEALFRTQPAWVKRDPQEARTELERISRQFGINETQFETCINDEQELERIRTVVEAGSEVYGINSTPSFVINGQKAEIRGASFDALDGAIRDALPPGTEVPEYTPAGLNETGAPEGEEGGFAADEGAAGEEPADEGTSEEGTSEEGTSDEGTSEEGTSEEGTSEEGASDEGTADEGTSEEGTSEEGSSEEGASEESTSDEGASEEGSTEDTSDDSTSDGSDSGDGGEEGSSEE
ncbi:MAG: thioredoxin domain-containing protein [Alphaproteobacteria bacterium]